MMGGAQPPASTPTSMPASTAQPPGHATGSAQPTLPLQLVSVVLLQVGRRQRHLLLLGGRGVRVERDPVQVLRAELRARYWHQPLTQCWGEMHAVSHAPHWLSLLVTSVQTMFPVPSSQGTSFGVGHVMQLDGLHGQQS